MKQLINILTQYKQTKIFPYDITYFFECVTYSNKNKYYDDFFIITQKINKSKLYLKNGNYKRNDKTSYINNIDKDIIKKLNNLINNNSDEYYKRLVNYIIDCISNKCIFWFSFKAFNMKYLILELLEYPNIPEDLIYDLTSVINLVNLKRSLYFN